MLCSSLNRTQANKLYFEALSSKNPDPIRKLCLGDLFFLISVACKRKDLNHDWLYDRCREVEANPDGYLDLWAREHYKSTIITFGLTIKDILNDPESTFGIFSHTRPIAKSFLMQIKRELESNKFLQDLFPDVLYKNPQAESPLWSLDGGIIVKRKSNPAVATVEAWGLVDGQPTSKHFKTLIYDDVVTRESVTTPEQIAKVNEAWALSLNLGSKEGSKVRYIGTRYHQLDTYKTIIERKSAVPRIYPATDTGKLEGNPVLMIREMLDKKRADMGPYIFGAQMLLDPVADNAMGFKEEWLMSYTELRNHQRWNYYLLCDPASAKKKDSDYTVMAVIGLAPDQNYYLLDGVRDRLNLTQRTDKLIEFHRKWKPVLTGYERYGKDSDIEHIKYVQGIETYHFEIQELGGSMAKPDRIRRLVPIFEQHRFFLPLRLPFVTAEGKLCDFVHEFKTQEFLFFPVCAHDDMLDCISRIVDIEMCAKFPKDDKSVFAAVPLKRNEYDPLKPTHQNNGEQQYNPLSPLART